MSNQFMPLTDWVLTPRAEGMYPVIVGEVDEEDGEAGYVTTIGYWNSRAFDPPAILVLDCPAIHFPTDIQRRLDEAKARVARILSAAGYRRAEWPPTEAEPEKEPGAEEPPAGEGGPLH